MSNTNDILIIDDESAIIDFMMEALQEDGYAVRSASNGEQGLTEIIRVPPALILLDMHMPGITTTEFLAHLRATNCPPIPIVIMTADKQAPATLATQRDVMYLFKPFNLDELLTCVAQFVRPLSKENDRDTYSTSEGYLLLP